jgi:DNA-binding NarL/FixJ family response regulator
MDSIRVVLIEDHFLTRVSIRTGLQQFHDIKVVGEAANAVMGLRMLQETKPDIAVVDIGLPDIDGIELTQRFKTHLGERVSSETKILVLTMQESEESVLAAFAAGADSYCLKDISIERLVKALWATYEGQSWIDPAIARIVLRQCQTAELQVHRNKNSKTVNIRAVDPEEDRLAQAYPLTERELEILTLIVRGHDNATLARELYISPGTIKTHIRNIFNKLCVDDRTQAAVFALRSGLVR